MQITPRQAPMQFAGLLQGTLFGALESVVGALSEQGKLLVSVLALVPPHAHVAGGRGLRGRPTKARQALATAFLAKAIYGFETTASTARSLALRPAVIAAVRMEQRRAGAQ